MSETWYVYRHSLANPDTDPGPGILPKPMLRSPKTELILTLSESPNCRAVFELMERQIDVEMVPDPTTDAWYGMDESGHLHFRWTQILPAGRPVLVGQVFDERAANHRRDFFVAVKSERVNPLPRQGRYDFAECHRTPYMRKKLPAWTGVSIFVQGEKRIEIGTPKTTYTIKDGGIEAYEDGLMVTGWHGDESLDLWLLPVDATGALLATGCYSHWPPGTSADTRPKDPQCVIGSGLR